MHFFPFFIIYTYEKNCKICSHKLHKNGTTKKGTVRFFCPNCGKSCVDKHLRQTQSNRIKMFKRWATGYQSLSQLSEKLGVSRKTIYNWFFKVKDCEYKLLSSSSSDAIVLIDGYFVRKDQVVLIAKNTNGKILFAHFTKGENYHTWKYVFNNLNGRPRALVCDGQRGCLKAIKESFDGVLIQRCQFHVIHHVNLILTKKPELIPSQELKFIVGKITQVKTIEEQKEWLLEFKDWYKRHELFIKQKTYQNEKTANNRLKWHYTHGKLHRAFSHVKNALPYLFTCVSNPTIPNTNNKIEGGTNAAIQRLLDRHRGTKLETQEKIIRILLCSQKNNNKK